MVWQVPISQTMSNCALAGAKRYIARQAAMSITVMAPRQPTGAVLPAGHARPRGCDVFLGGATLTMPRVCASDNPFGGIDIVNFQSGIWSA